MFSRRKAPAPSPHRRETSLAVARRLEANPQVTPAGIAGLQLYYYLDFFGPGQCDTLIA